jgi:hypothetical protein
MQVMNSDRKSSNSNIQYIVRTKIKEKKKQ